MIMMPHRAVTVAGPTLRLRVTVTGRLGPGSLSAARGPDMYGIYLYDSDAANLKHLQEFQEYGNFNMRHSRCILCISCM
jgi:lysozyme family protein